MLQTSSAPSLCSVSAAVVLVPDHCTVFYCCVCFKENAPAGYGFVNRFTNSAVLKHYSAVNSTVSDSYSGLNASLKYEVEIFIYLTVSNLQMIEAIIFISQTH